MGFPSGRLARYFQPSEAPALVCDSARQAELVLSTNCLVVPCLDNTEFCRGRLDLSCLGALPLFTILARRNRGKMPYLLADLVTDLRAGALDRATIDEQTEIAIRSLADDVGRVAAVPAPVIVEDSSGNHYLILDGNKRLSALALADSRRLPDAVEACVGRSVLTWGELLAHYNMNPAA